MSSEIEPGEQATLLNIDTKEISAYWVDPGQPLLVPTNPLHYAAHKYQLILARLDKQAARNPAQFNSGNYVLIMEKLEKLWEQINKGDTVAVHGSPEVATDGDETAAPAMGNGNAAGVRAGISADNPLAG